MRRTQRGDGIQQSLSLFLNLGGIVERGGGQEGKADSPTVASFATVLLEMQGDPLMTAKPEDDFDAVRAIVEALKAFDAKDQERIIRWAREKVGLSSPTVSPSPSAPIPETLRPAAPGLPTDAVRSKDIRSFIDSKKPQSDNQFAAAVAYFYRFEAPEVERKSEVTAEDIQDAARKAGRPRLTNPAQTLRNAHGQGYFDKSAERGHFTLSTVGENLVAMALPQGGTTAPSRAPKRRAAGKKKKQ
jgi:hypothetical protein